MPPRHPFIPAEQQRIHSMQAVMSAGQDTCRYGAELVAASFAAMHERGGEQSPVSGSEE